MKENKAHYLAPRGSVVAFKVEGGFDLSKNGTSFFQTTTMSNRNDAYDVQDPTAEGSQWKPFQ